MGRVLSRQELDTISFNVLTLLCLLCMDCEGSGPLDRKDSAHSDEYQFTFGVLWNEAPPQEVILGCFDNQPP